jgi:hypothetical protein
MMNRQGKNGSFIALVVVVFLLAAAISVSAAPNIKEKGLLEAIGEDNRSVTIMTQGPSVDKVEREYRAVYPLVPNVIVLDGFGKRTKVDALPLPVKVEFEVEYTPTRALIKKINVRPQ